MTRDADIPHKAGEARAGGGGRSGRTAIVLAVLMLVNILNFLDRQLLFVLADAIKADLGLSDTQLGLLTGLAFVGCYSIAALPLAWIADRWSPKLTLTGVISLWSLMTLAGGAAATFGQLALSRVGVAVGEAGSTPSSHAVIQNSLSSSRRGLALGVFQIGTPIGTMLGMAVGGWLGSVAGWRMAMVSAGAAGFVVVLLVALLIPDARTPHRTGTSAVLADYLRVVRVLFADPAYRWMFIGMSIVGAGAYGGMVFSTPFFLRLHGLSLAQAGLFIGFILGVAGMIGTLIAGLLFDRAATRGSPLFWPGMVLVTTGVIQVGSLFVGSSALALALFIPFGFAAAYYLPAVYGTAHVIAGPGNQAIATSFLLLGASLVGGVIGPIVIGHLSDRLAPQMGPSSLRFAMLVVPVALAGAGAAFLRANAVLKNSARAAPSPAGRP